MGNHSLRRSLIVRFLLVLALFGLAAQAQQGKPPRWPSLQEQLERDNIDPQSNLAALIAAHQDFGLLRAEEARDKVRIPAFLRVIWRKAHPEGDYSMKDPTGGYPFVLKEVYEWMLTHPNLEPGPGLDGFEIEGLDVDLKSVSGETRISGAASNPRSESDIRMNYNNNNLIIAASNNIGGNGQQAQYYSTNGGSTWGVSFLPLISGDAFMSDPTVDWTSDGTAWSTTIGINSSGTTLNMLSYKSTNNGATWTFDATFSGSQSSADKQLMWVDHSATSSFKDNIYACWHNGTPQYVNRRTSTGWGTPIQISGSESTGTAIGCDVKSNAAGDVFVFWPTTGNRRIIVAKSTNGGASWGTPVIIANTYDSFDIGVPSFNSRRILIYVSAAAYGSNVYATWTDLSGATGCTSASNEPGSNVSSSCKTRVWFSRSTNGGTSWSTPVKINDQAGLNDQFNQAIVVDETNGDLAVMYYDTVGDAGRKKTDVWFQSSTNGGVSWSTPEKVTSAQTDETISGADSGNQYGDYNSITGYAGLFFPVWTDRRSGAREEIWTAAVTSGGTGCTPPLAPTGLSATAVSSSQINLSWTGVGGGATYNIYRGTTSGGPYTQIASGLSATSYSSTGLSASTTYYYVVRSFLSCESGNSNQASATTQAGGGCSTSTLYSNGFESGTGLGGWTKGVFGGTSTTSWRGIQTCSAQTGSKVFRYGGSGCTGNYSNSNFNFAKPPAISVPSGSSTTRLTFGHRRRFESGYDGATLAVSLDGSSYTLVPASAIISGSAYNSTVDAACPPAGTAGFPIWTGASTTFSNVTVDLDAACVAAGASGGCGGQTVHVAFTTITDCSATDDGWFLDNVTVTACTP